MSLCWSAAVPRTPKVYEVERREMRQESDAELLKARATGSECKKELAEEELQHREYAHNVEADRQIAKCTVVVAIIALVVSIVAIVVSAH
jgi:hypothetical protein